MKLLSRLCFHISGDKDPRIVVSLDIVSDKVVIDTMLRERLSCNKHN